MKIIQLAHRTVDELLEEIFAITSKKKIDTSDKRVLYAVACAMKNRYENDVPKWIPVSERLPEEDGKYMVTIHGYGWNGKTFTSVSVAECIGKRWVGNNGVIAWMSLPEAYKSNK